MCLYLNSQVYMYTLDILPIYTWNTNIKCFHHIYTMYSYVMNIITIKGMCKGKNEVNKYVYIYQ